MNKEILYPVAAALLASTATWFIANSVDFTSKHQRQKIATEIMGDDEFRKILARDITKNKELLEELKKDEEFRGKDGNSPAAEAVAEVLRDDGDFVGNLISKPKWPHAINCGGSWDTFYILISYRNTDQGSAGGAQYTQAYKNEDRRVIFDNNGALSKREGNKGASKGCENKSIDQLRKEGRTYHFISE